MPTIQQLPSATAVTAADLLPLSQNGLTRSVTISTLLNGTQPTLALAQGTILGRSSNGLGGPEGIAVGTGLSLQAGTVSATGVDHVSLPLSTTLFTGDEVVVNSNSAPKRLPASALRSLFSAGTGVTIDPNGVISSTGSGTGGGTGAQGPKGDTGSQGPAGQGFTFRGAWQAFATYSAYDVLVYGGQSYTATTSFTSGAAFDSTHLTLIAAQGSAGSVGAQGPAGPQGPAGAQGPSGPIVSATSTTLGAVKPGAGLTVSSDGTVSIANVSLSSLAQTGATTGQLLGWTGTGWGPTTATAGGVSTFNSRSGPVSLTLGDVTAVLGTAAGARASLGLATVAATGVYSDLTGAPAIPAASTAAPAANGTASAGVSGSFARADHIHPSDASRLAASSNLADVANASVARTNLGLGPAATLSVGSTAGTVAAGNDSRITGALQAAAIPAASGQLLGGSGTAGGAVAVALGTGLTLSGGTLSATGGGSNYTLAPASTTALGGVKPDGTTITAAADGTLTVAGISLGALADIGTLGGPALSDVDILNRNGNDYKTTLSARVSLFRKTPAASRTVTLATGSTTATLTATDNDKTIVVNGVAGALAADGTITDGFRCQVINHTAAALNFSGITGLGGATSVAGGAACWVSFANAAVEAALSGTSGGGGGSYTLPVATTTTLGGVKSDGSTITTAADGTLSVAGTSTMSLTDIATLGGPALSDVDVLNRSGTDYRTTLSARTALFRKTPAGSRTITLATGATTAVLTAADHDKTVVVAGAAGTLSVDGTITDGFRCQVINHTGVALSYSGITGLQGITSLANSNSTVISMANSTIEATAPGSPPVSYFTVGVSGVVSSLPGGAGAVIYRHVFVRPCTLAVNLAAPFPPQGQAGTLPSNSASFGLIKRQAGGTQTTLGGLTMSTTGVIAASVPSSTSFVAGDELIFTAPSPADSTLADVAITFTGTWG